MALLLVVVCSSPAVWAQSSNKAPTGQSPADTFSIPEGLNTPEQSFEFIEEMVANNEPADRSEATMMAYQRKLARTVVLVVEKMLAMETANEEAMQAHFFKLQALRLLSELNEPGAKEHFARAIADARQDPRADVRAIGMKFLVENGFSKWPVWGKEEKTGLMSALVEFFQQGEPDVEQLDMLLTVINFLDQMQDGQFAKPMLAELTPHFRNSKSEIVQQMVTRLEGIARRLNLPGKQMELKGTLLDGAELDWESYRGKVVLVDFWATWCGPCRQEVPNILRLYRAYHEKGFEVVGVSLDSRREEAESYIEQYDVPWPNLFSEKENERSWEHPMAIHYGITGIPLAILIDRDGTVVSLLARGENLARELHRLLGEPLARSQTVADPLVRQVDTSAETE
ncbi:MAG: TlpA family protein disulfide reductase [Planctomycetes bacterium]|nr:TlpA family protein disulfide reductase [Planctomycetota bacterium]